MARFLSGIAVALILSGCATSFTTTHPTMSAEDVVALRSFHGKAVKLGEFTSSKPGQSELVCRGTGHIQNPDGEPFAESIRKALQSELVLGNVYSDSAPVTITGRVDSIDASSWSGHWTITLTLKSSNGKSMTVHDDFHFAAPANGDVACGQTAQAYAPAVQNLIEKTISSPEFAALISS